MDELVEGCQPVVDGIVAVNGVVIVGRVNEVAKNGGE